jgi:hypothetical protein
MFAYVRLTLTAPAEYVKINIQDRPVHRNPNDPTVLYVEGPIRQECFSEVKINKTVYPFERLPYDYILVLDFEANCIERGKMECQEIIEFPVKALNL